MKRKQPTLTVKLAAALLTMRDNGGMPLIPWEDAKLMTASQIVSLFQFDHYPIRHVDGGPDEPWNLVPRFIKGHRVKTATVDRPEIAKTRRIDTKWKEFTARMQAKATGTVEDLAGKRKRTIPSRPFPKKRREGK